MGSGIDESRLKRDEHVEIQARVKERSRLDGGTSEDLFLDKGDRSKRPNDSRLVVMLWGRRDYKMLGTQVRDVCGLAPSCAGQAALLVQS